jgi:HEAT repeat protein
MYFISLEFSIKFPENLSHTRITISLKKYSYKSEENKMAQTSETASDEWFNQFARTALIYRIMDEALAGEESEDRTRAIISLGERRDPRAVVTLMECCIDEDPEIRMNAIDALCKLKSGRAVPVLVERLNDQGEFHENRCLAAMALAATRTNTAIAGLNEIVNNENEDPALREYVAVVMEG